MRVTDNLRYSAIVTAMQKKSSRLHELNQQAVTGQKVSRPSDDPGAFAAAVNGSARLEQLDGRKQAIDRAHGDLAHTEGVLSESGDLLKRARELAVQMADGAYDANERAVAADEVAAIRDQLKALANTRGTRGYLFSGTATDTAPIDASGAFVANDSVMGVTISDGVQAPANIPGGETFSGTNGGRDIFQDLADLETALLADNQVAIQQGIDDMDQGHTQISGARAEAGIAMDRLTTASNVLGGSMVTVTEGLAAIVEADPFQAFSELARAQSSYEESISVARSVLQMATAVQRF
jgi:flagellar hook-associated protein 3 FlgL